MRFSLEKFSNLDIGWNERPLTDDDFYRLCRRFRITVEEIPLRVSGFYYCVMGRHFIAIDSKLPPRRKQFVMFHEFAHYLIHAPDAGVTASFHGVGRKTRKEFEADAFATCALVPRRMVESRSVQELVEEDGLPEELISARVELYRTLGI